MGRGAVIWNMPQLFDTLRDTYAGRSARTEEEILTEAKRADLLVLDDVGAEGYRDASWYQGVVYRLLVPRERFRNWTVMTTGLPPEALYDRVGAKMTSYMRGMFGHPLQLSGPDRRRLRRLTKAR